MCFEAQAKIHIKYTYQYKYKYLNIKHVIIYTSTYVNNNVIKYYQIFQMEHIRHISNNTSILRTLHLYLLYLTREFY